MTSLVRFTPHISHFRFALDKHQHFNFQQCQYGIVYCKKPGFDTARLPNFNSKMHPSYQISFCDTVLKYLRYFKKKKKKKHLRIKIILLKIHRVVVYILQGRVGGKYLTKDNNERLKDLDLAFLVRKGKSPTCLWGKHSFLQPFFQSDVFSTCLFPFLAILAQQFLKFCLFLFNDPYSFCDFHASTFPFNSSLLHVQNATTGLAV